ncbi:hypothetical protein [Petroclostridium xylanilyticum]|uniref:hypothetical protein n=1 Tax=Petroclostridium xylanilyticum TaxID=1792311 RepID=UPI000B994410|nr:hypothetical protein [Petroclostridium xylanilyticum]
MIKLLLANLNNENRPYCFSIVSYCFCGEYTYKLFGVKDIVVVYQKDYEIKCKIGVGFIDGDVATYTINHYIN